MIFILLETKPAKVSDKALREQNQNITTKIGTKEFNTKIEPGMLDSY